MKFEVGGTFCVDASVDKGDMRCEFGDAFIEVHDLDETLVGRSCMDAVVTISPSSNLIGLVSSDPLDIFHAFPSCSLLCISPECCNMSLIDSHVVLEGNEINYYESPSTFRGYNSFLDPCSLYLEDLPRKIMLIIAFDCSIDFSEAFDKLRRALTIIPRFIVCSYFNSSELHAQVFDKLVRVLMVSELGAWILR